MSGIFNDSKEFVDMPLKRNWTKSIEQEIVSARDNIELKQKLDQYFYAAGTREWHNENVTSKDVLKLIDRIKDKQYKKWAKFLCHEWRKLVRKINPDVKTNNQRYSMIYLNEKLVVPGGRFREMYYWDTYWSIEGLLHCEMYETTKNILQDLLQMVQLYGFVPNGGRKYYENRSQPPFLTLMVLKYYEATKDSSFVIRNYKTLLKEHDFWMRERVVEVIKNGTTYKLNRYFSKLGYPRPESFKEDKELVEEYYSDPKQRQEVYSHIASAAESGWDFSSRFAPFSFQRER